MKKIEVKVGQKVRLKTFNGKQHLVRKAHPSEDYWKLVGEVGTIQQDPHERSVYAGFSKKPRVLVRFDKSLEGYGLVCHNNIGNSLWILLSDLESVASSHQGTNAPSGTSEKKEHPSN